MREHRAEKKKPMTFSSLGISNIAWPSDALDDALDRAVAQDSMQSRSHPIGRSANGMFRSGD